MDRFFYHSFPRRPSDVGLRILESICRNGLLLVPEEIEWTDPVQPNPTLKTRAVQRRICFTELSPAELGEHAKVFGNFALEFDVEALRSMGAMPVIYVPDVQSATSVYDMTGTSLLSNLAAAQTVLQSMADVIASADRTLEATLTFKDGSIHEPHFSARDTRKIKEFIGLFEQAQGLTIKGIANAMLSLSSLFYPTENMKYNGQLAYYRQREWRIISGSFINGVPTTELITEEQANELLSIDNAFFSKQIKFADGLHSIASKCHYFSKFHDKAVISKIRRIIVPDEYLEKAKKIVEIQAPMLTVAPISDLSDG